MLPAIFAFYRSGVAVVRTQVRHNVSLLERRADLPSDVRRASHVVGRRGQQGAVIDRCPSR